MKILYHHRTQAEDGQAVHIRALMRAFEQCGHQVREVSLVSRSDEPPAPSKPDEKAASSWSWISRVPRFARELMEYAYSVPARRKITSAVREDRPDFIYERYAFGNAGGVWAKERLGLPLVLEVNSPMVLELGRTRGLSFPGLAGRTERSIFQGADVVCVVTDVLGGMLRDLGVAPERLLVTPNGVHLEQYDYDDRAETRAVAMRDLGVPEERRSDVVLGFVGYYRRWHRLDLVLQALAREDLAGASLVIIGDGPAHEELEQEAARLGVRDRLVFAGPRPHREIPKLLPAFDVALVPAINPYASPLKLHEYMAAELAVVAPDQPNLREVLTHGENGLLVEPGDGASLAEALARLVADQNLRRELGAAARGTIESRDMTWIGNAKRVIEAVEPLL